MASKVVPLFIAGCPRSGTTALARLINLHPEIVVGIERFKTIYGREKRIDASMFEEERFFDFRPEETHWTPAAKPAADLFYRNARRKYKTARFIGDKYPQFYRFYGGILKAFPDARIVFIYRDPVAVARSWQQRADRGGTWPAKNDARRSVTYWNDALANTLAAAAAAPQAFWFVEYEEFFRRQRPALLALLESLGVNSDRDELERVGAASEDEFGRSGDILNRPIDLPLETIRHIQSQADYGQLERVRALARRSASGAAGS